MIYDNTVKGVFLERPNRFIAKVQLEGREEICHVKNTGRCAEILRPGAEVILEKSLNPNRKTAFSLIAAYKGDMLINIDSQAPNKVVGEWLQRGDCIPKLNYIKAEYRYGASRLDFYAEAPGEKHLIEVKGVTLERDGLILFPDAPTVRGTRHIHELISSIKDGFIPHIFFVVQLEKAEAFTANAANDPNFAGALSEAKSSGVDIRAVCCNVKENGLMIPTGYKELNLVSI